MKRLATSLLPGLVLAAAACGPAADDEVTGTATAAPPAELIVLDRTYERLIEDFNARVGTTRIVTILPPT